MDTIIILAVDDEPLILRAVERTLARVGTVVRAASVERALSLLEEHEVDVAVLDFHVGSSLDVLVRALQKRGVPFFFYTGSPAAARRAYPSVAILSKGEEGLREAVARHSQTKEPSKTRGRRGRAAATDDES
ncbi:MAG: hypothetical protein AAGE52_07445 [Myxococcota bacterium]